MIYSLSHQRFLSELLHNFQGKCTAIINYLVSDLYNCVLIVICNQLIEMEKPLRLKITVCSYVSIRIQKGSIDCKLLNQIV